MDEDNEYQPQAKRPRQLDSAEVGRDDQLNNARGSGDVIDGHLGSTKAAGESDTEYVLRAGR